MFEDKVVVVTGGSRGIGLAAVKDFYSKGATVYALHSGKTRVSEMEGLEGVKDIVCDVRSFEDTGKAVEKILEESGKIDILVNCAGITKDSLLLSMKEKDFDDVIDVNLKGTFNMMKHVFKPMMGKRYGRIINLSSIAGVSGNAGQVNYSASKAGVIGMTKSAARELAGRNVTVNAVAPGFIETDMTDKLSEKARENILSKIPMKRAGNVSDISDLILFLAGDGASYITGQVIVCDGGLVI